MAGAWKQYLDFTEPPGNNRVEEHRECLYRLKESIREVLRTALHARRQSVAGADDAAASLLLIERTLRGQTCSFGGHVFCNRQACIVLLNLLKLLPEPSCESFAPALLSTTALLVEQLARQDFSLLQSFLSDCIGALSSARERPFKVHVFPKFVQGCKATITDDKGAPPSLGATEGFSLELYPAVRLATFSARLVSLTGHVVGSLISFASLFELDAFLGSLLGLASDAVSWTEQTFEASDGAKIVSACIANLQSLLVDSAWSLHVQARTLDELPRITAFALNECDSSLQTVMLELVSQCIAGFDEALLFPRLRELLSPFLASSIAPDVSASVLLTAAKRFGDVGMPLDVLLHSLALRNPDSAASSGTLSSIMPLEPHVHAALGSAFHSLGLHFAICSYAVRGCSRGAGQLTTGTVDTFLQLQLACLAVRSLPLADRQGRPHDELCSTVCASLEEQAGTCFRQPLPREPGLHASSFQILLEVLLVSPACVSKLDSQGRMLLTRLTQEVSQGRPTATLWRIFMLALEVFALQSRVSFAVKFSLVQSLLAKPKAARPPWLDLAGWIVIGGALRMHLEELLAASPEAIAAKTAPTSKEQVDEMLPVVKQLIEHIASSALQDAAKSHPSVRAALAYVFPMLITLLYTLPPLRKHGAKPQMPQLSQAFAATSPHGSASYLCSLGSPVRSVPNQLKVTPVFSNLNFAGSEDRGGSSGDAQSHVPLPACCPFCNQTTSSSDMSFTKLPATTCSLLGSACRACSFDGIQLDWSIFKGRQCERSFVLPEVWHKCRHPDSSHGQAECCWLQNWRELLEAFQHLCRAASTGPTQHALNLLEPGDSQEAPHVVRRSTSSDLKWLLSCGLFGICASASCDQLSEQASTITRLLSQCLPDSGGNGNSWELGSSPNFLYALVQSNSFVSALLEGKARNSPLLEDVPRPLSERQESGTHRALQAAQRSCLEWRLKLLSKEGTSIAASKSAGSRAVATTSKAPLDEGLAVLTAGQASVAPPLLLHAILASAPMLTVSSALSLFVAGAVMGVGAGSSDITSLVSVDACLQHLLLFGMIAMQPTDALFSNLQSQMYLRLFEKYSAQNLRVGGLCELFLRSPLKERVRSLLPKILPPMVLSKSMKTIQDLCALLEESVQSLFTPQLPFILSAIAQQPVQQVAGAFMFILESVYNNQMTITNICDASLGKVLMLILWGSAAVDGDDEAGKDRHATAHRRALAAIDNIVSALQAHRPKPDEHGRKRKVTDLLAESSGSMASSLNAGAATAAAGPAKKKGRGKGGNAITVEEEASREVAQTLEDNFLHVLDILEIVCSGQRHNRKFTEYSYLLWGALEGRAETDYHRLFASIALLFDLVPGSLHRFAPKIFEFLQSATVLSNYHLGSVRCWQLFVNSVGVSRLRPLIPAVVGELLRLATQLQHRSQEAFQFLCNGLIVRIVEATCKENSDLVVSLPSLPTWSVLSTAQRSIESALGTRAANNFAQKLEVGVAQLEGATQQAVKSAALENIKDLLAVHRRRAPTNVAELHTPLLARLMRALLKFLWESSARPTDQLHCGELLGTLGAVDPSRFSHLDLGKGRTTRAPQDLGNTQLLAKKVLTEFLVPNLTSKNSYAFAVQEILKYLRGGRHADSILADLKDDMRETLKPYLNSSYQLIQSAQTSSDASSFESVLTKAVFLVQSEQKALFEACLPAVHDNHALALFLMHHVLHDLLNSTGTILLDLEQLSRALVHLLDSPRHSTAQAVFSLVDDMLQRREQLEFVEIPGIQARRGDDTAKKRQLQRIDSIMKWITHRKIVDASVQCGAHARALQFFEQAIIDEYRRGVNPFDAPRIESENDCLLLQSIYRNLDEPDGMLGALRIGPATVKMRTLQVEQSGRWTDVLSCYEEQLSSLTASGDKSRNALQQRQELLGGLVRCTMNMRRFESSLRLIQGMEKEDGMQTRLGPYAAEAAWQLSSWDRLKQGLQMSKDGGEDHDFQNKLGEALLSLHEQNHEQLRVVLRETRLQVTRTVASTARESYTRAYPHLLKLHVLSDIEWLHTCRESGLSSGKPLAPDLLARLDAVAPTFSARQLLLSPLRVALMDMGLIEDAKHVELAFSRESRKHDVPIAMEHPSLSFCQVSPELLARAQLEWGKLLYARGSRLEALRHMQELAACNPRARLLGTRWATEASSELLIPKVVEAEFKEVKERLPQEEAAWFYHASYLDQLLKEQMSGKWSTGPTRMLQRTSSATSVCPFDLKNLITFTLRGYLQALQRGNKRLHFILNRVLQLAWDCCELDFFKREALLEIESQAEHMQPWMWYVVLPQLISRVHNADMRPVFSKLIMTVFMAYPMQAGWQMVQLLKSNDNQHKDLGHKLVLEVSRKSQRVHATMVPYVKVANDMMSLAQWNPPDGAQTINLRSTHGQPFAKLLGGSRQADTWEVLVPVQSQMTAALPRMCSPQEVSKPFDPFRGPHGDSQVKTQRCLEIVDVFRTKEKPKKITFLGEDGREYPFLCKCERRGDLRKDSRMMEFGVMVNQLLQRNPDARRRNLEVRTFHVVIFQESCGLIEWVPNTRGMRNIIDDLWRKLRPGLQQSVRDIKELVDHSADLYETYTKQILPRHPPVLHRWFTLNADPSVWLSKRLTFSRSQALWCMLGYIVGLGDRHGENILLDTESGRMVHVDFDCLFGKGMQLEKPETVPFRLTQNCVAAMGITGVEGIFRECCELCMEVLRDRSNQQTLLSVLHVFIADPLIEWTSRTQRERHDEQRTQQARSTIGDVEKKLNGMLNVGAVVKLKARHDHESVLSPEERGRGLLGRDRGVGLSVAGQVDELLKAAMCKRNLSAMYVGWQPWM